MSVCLLRKRIVYNAKEKLANLHLPCHAHVTRNYRDLFGTVMVVWHLCEATALGLATARTYPNLVFWWTLPPVTLHSQAISRYLRASNRTCGRAYRVRPNWSICKVLRPAWYSRERSLKSLGHVYSMPPAVRTLTTPRSHLRFATLRTTSTHAKTPPPSGPSHPCLGPGTWRVAGPTGTGGSSWAAFRTAGARRGVGWGGGR